MADTFIAKNWRDLIKPRGMEVDQDSLSPTYGKFVAEPLERGFGTTLGNSLRRVLLSSLQGAAITSVKIEGVEHEFTTIPEVVEDVTDVVLNLKEVLLRMHTNETKTLRIEVDGPKDVKAGDIIADDQVEILNPGHHICSVSEGGKLRLEMTCRRGRGYVPAAANKVAGSPIGTIPIDSLFSPVRKVNYQVTNARVGQVTDYDKLTLEVWARQRGAPGRGGVRGEDHQGAAHGLRELRRDGGAHAGGGPQGGGQAQREPLPLGGRAGALGALGQLPAAGQHQDHR
jgi:DNA-directed RNA polymerase subunit alpha